MNHDTHQESSTKPFVSVVVPTCNRCDEIARCLDALLRQTYPNLEVIVIDDGSSDGTPALLEGYLRQFPDGGLVCLRNESSIGANPSRNRGIRASRGTLIAFEDSDCVARPDWIEKLVAAFASDRVGAVTGLVEDPPPRNIFELALRGTHRVAGSVFANRLVGGNMCVRRDLLRQDALDEDRATPASRRDGRPDVTASGRGDEEGLFLRLRAAGHEVRVTRDAVVLHEHYYTARSFFRQAFRGGRSAARLVYKFHLRPRLDMLPFLLAYLSLPLVLWSRTLGCVPGFFFLAALTAMTYNDLFRKQKTVSQTLRSFPVLLVYYHVRLVAYVIETISLRIRRHDIKRVRLSGG
ncbi:MAG: glycosyltransferase family 2 protein [Planctomycetes bacterium]|nr:glycosyltransferase family 2 protein [Planctomycetota bacterium]